MVQGGDKIQNLKNHHVVVVSSQTKIKEAFKNYFQYIYLSSNPSILDTAKETQEVASKVTTDMNNSLT